VIQGVEPGIAVGLKEPGEVRRMRAATIGAVEVGGRQRRGTGKQPVIAHIDP